MEPAQPARPPLTHAGVVAWSLGVTLVSSLVAQEVFWAFPSARHDLVILVSAQLPVYLAGCALFAARRPGRSFEQLFALRRAPVGLLVTGLLLGVAMHPAAEKLNELIMQLFPLKKDVSEELASRLLPHGIAHGVVLVAMVALVGPIVEELLFRGALYTSLRARTNAASAAMTTGLMFTFIHVEPRSFLPIFMLACCLGYLRALSGSLWPGVLLHGAFNASSLALAWLGESAEIKWLSLPVVGGSAVAALLLIVLAARLAQKNGLVERARAFDRTQPAGDGATP